MSWLWLILALGAAAWALKKSGGSGHAAKRKLLLVNLCLPGEAPGATAEWAADMLNREVGLQVSVRAEPLTIPGNVFHPQTRQADAVALVEALEPLVTADCAVLGFTDYDLHSPMRRDLPFAMGARKGLAGLISTYRMQDKLRAQNTLDRLHKMLVRYVLEIVCDASRDHNPQSLLYEHLHRPEQLDIMRPDWDAGA